MFEKQSVQIPKQYNVFVFPVVPVVCPWYCPGVSCKSVLLKQGDINPLLCSSQDNLKKTNKWMPNTFSHVKLEALPPDSNPFKA